MPASIRLDDAPWRRLPWSLPAGALLVLLGLLGLVRLLAEIPPERAKPLALSAQLLEVPAPGPVAPAAAAAPEPEQAAPPPAELPPPRPREHRPPKPAPTTTAVPSAAATAESNATASTARAGAEASAAAPSLPGGRMSARALYQPVPEIPEELRRQNLEAVALARFRVAADGTTQVELVRATNDTRLNQALLAALARWRFFPAMEQGRPVASEVELRVPISVH